MSISAISSVASFIRISGSDKAQLFGVAKAAAETTKVGNVPIDTVDTDKFSARKTDRPVKDTSLPQTIYNNRALYHAANQKPPVTDKVYYGDQSETKLPVRLPPVPEPAGEIEIPDDIFVVDTKDTRIPVRLPPVVEPEEPQAWIDPATMKIPPKLPPINEPGNPTSFGQAPGELIEDYAPVDLLV